MQIIRDGTELVYHQLYFVLAPCYAFYRQGRIDWRLEVVKMVEHNKIHTLVYDVIKRYASEENPIDLKDIQKILDKDPDNACERMTVSRALERLRAMYGKDDNGYWLNEDIKLHYEVVDRKPSAICRQYWLEICKDEGFTDDELMYLMVAVQFSKHIENKFAEEIVRKLMNLSNNKYSGVFEFHTKVNEKNMPIKQDFLVLLGDLNDAIRHRTMVSFFENDYGTDKALHHVGNRPVEAMPFRIVASEGYFYLLYSERNSSAIKNIRLDKISDLVDLKEEFFYTKAQEKALFYPNEYIVEHRYMNSGEPVEVTLRIEKSILGDVIDSFGTKIRFEPAHRSANRINVHVKSSERDIVDWAMRYGEYAVILEPDYLRNAVMDRVSLIRSAYIERDSEIDYLERIKFARKNKRVSFINMDLNGQDSYMDLDEVQSAVFCHNGINDFSFLTSYEHLRDLAISRNDISDPGVLGELSELNNLGLAGTGITNLEFLAGLNNLKGLSLNEYAIDSFEPVYQMPNLKSLTVNRAIARQLDKKRLKRVYGDLFELNIEEYRGLTAIPLRIRYNDSLPKNADRLVIRDTEALNALTTFEVTDPAEKNMLSRNLYTGSSGMDRLRKRFSLVKDACDGNERIDLFEDVTRFASDEYSWFITYDGEAGEEISEDDLDNIYAVSIFKRDHGLKLICFANSRHPGIGEDAGNYRESRNRSMLGSFAHIQYILNNNIGWAEVSKDLEGLFNRVASINDVINPVILMNHRIYGDIRIDEDEYHYTRTGDDGKKAKKIAFGHIELG